MKFTWKPDLMYLVPGVFPLAIVGISAHALAGATATITLQPVQPTAFPPVSYPPGTTIVGQEIILGSVPARVWLEIQITGWEPDVLKTAQATISATDWEQDGGGFAGSTAICNGEPANGGNLAPAMQSCTVNADCRAISGPACGIVEASKCVTWDGVNPSYFPAGHFCEPAFQNRCHPRWAVQGLSCVSAIDYGDGPNYRIGFSCNPGEIPVDYHPSYMGTVVLDIPGNAKGTYTIDFDETQTFVSYPDSFCDPGPCPLQLRVAKITVPCGRCCYELGSASPQCVDHVSANECAGYGVGAVFGANEDCPADGGAACPECGTDTDCDDGIACTVNRCGSAHACFYEPDDSLCDDGVFCNGPEICNALTGCGPGQPPCIYYECDEDAGACHPGIPTVSNWGLAVLVLTLLIAAKLARRQVA